MALFGYAALFSFAYLQLATGTGALLLFGAVQLTLLAIYWWQGERFQFLEIIGIGLSIVGFVWLMLPSATRPDISSALLMLISGVCWAAFTALGKQAPSPSSGITWGVYRCIYDWHTPITIDAVLNLSLFERNLARYHVWRHCIWPWVYALVSSHA